MSQYSQDKNKVFSGTTSKKTTSYFGESSQKNSGLTNNDLEITGEIQNNKITFNFFGGFAHSLTNRDLRLRNQSTTHSIRFRIKSNNPDRYKVHPYKAILLPNKTVEIIIQLIIDFDENEEIGPRYFSKFSSDKFKIIWSSYLAEKEKMVTAKSSNPFQHSKTFSVVVKNHSQEQEAECPQRKKSGELEEIVMQTLKQKKKQLKMLKVKMQEKEGQRVESSLVTCGAVIVLSFFSFLLGVLISI